MYAGQIFDTEGEQYTVHNYNEAIDIINTLADTYSNLITTYSIGKTVEGRDIPVVELHSKDKDVNGHIVITGGHHGTEPAGTEAALCLIEKLVTADTDKARYLLDNYQIDIIPAVNADMLARPFGYDYVENKLAKKHPNYRQYDNAAGELTNQYKEKTFVVDPIKKAIDEALDLDLSPEAEKTFKPSLESKHVANYIDLITAENKIALSIDYHESYEFDGFCLGRNEEGYSIGKGLIDALKEKNLPIQEMSAPMLIGLYCEGVLDMKDDLFSMTFSGYCEQKGCEQNLIFETPTMNSMATRISMNLIATEKAIEEIIFDNVN